MEDQEGADRNMTESGEPLDELKRALGDSFMTLANRSGNLATSRNLDSFDVDPNDMSERVENALDVLVDEMVENFLKLAKEMNNPTGFYFYLVELYKQNMVGVNVPIYVEQFGGFLQKLRGKLSEKTGEQWAIDLYGMLTTLGIIKERLDQVSVDAAKSSFGSCMDVLQNVVGNMATDFDYQDMYDVEKDLFNSIYLKAIESALVFVEEMGTDEWEDFLNENYELRLVQVSRRTGGRGQEPFKHAFMHLLMSLYTDLGMRQATLKDGTGALVIVWGIHEDIGD